MFTLDLFVFYFLAHGGPMAPDGGDEGGETLPGQNFVGILMADI
jgi:hypothetical protein